MDQDRRTCPAGRFHPRCTHASVNAYIRLKCRCPGSVQAYTARRQRLDVKATPPNWVAQRGRGVDDVVVLKLCRPDLRATWTERIRATADERTVAVVELHRARIPARTIAERLDVSIRTVQRHLRWWRENGLPACDE